MQGKNKLFKFMVHNNKVIARIIHPDKKKQWSSWVVDPKKKGQAFGIVFSVGISSSCSIPVNNRSQSNSWFIRNELS